MNNAASGMEWYSSPTFILSGWVLALVLALLFATVVSFMPDKFERLRRYLFPVIILPAVLIALLYAIRGFEPLDRQIVHWIFRKDAVDSLRLGVLFDPLSFIVSLGFGLILSAVCFRNRPMARVSSALVLSGVGLCLVASSKTLWMAGLGLGIQMMAKLLPVLSIQDENSDAVWNATAKRSWIALMMFLAGGVGLASQGAHLDFSVAQSWSTLPPSLPVLISASLLGLGLVFLGAPALTVHVLHQDFNSNVEEENFIYESAGAWSAALILYRMMPNLIDTPWALALGILATFLLLLSVVTGVFLESRPRAIHHWLASVPLLVLSILPFLEAQQAFLWVAGSVTAFCGAFLSFDHRRKPLEQTLAAVFYVGLFGFIGWSSSAGPLQFFSKFEAFPPLSSGVFIVWLLFAMMGWRIVLRGGGTSERGSPAAVWVVQGILFLVGFGPLLSGRWSGGGIPENVDTFAGSREWVWIKQYQNNFSESNWVGFAVVLSLIFIAILAGTFVSRSSTLFPFAERNPRGKKAAQNLFGLFWVSSQVSVGLTKFGEVWEILSSRVWEKWIPATVSATYRGFQIVGTRAENFTDNITAEKYGKLFSAPSKLVQWLHGGNVRLYAWFALVWVLIFSIYLTR